MAGKQRVTPLKSFSDLVPPDPEKMEYGRITYFSFNANGGYGFITAKDGSQIHFLKKNVKNVRREVCSHCGCHGIHPGPVLFYAVPTDQGFHAKVVAVVEAPKSVRPNTFTPAKPAVSA